MNTTPPPARGNRLRALLALATVLLALCISLLSASIRHASGGPGCEPWPACYGRIGADASRVEGTGVARAALAPADLARRAHRIAASTLVVLVLLLVQRRLADPAWKAPEPLWLAVLLVLLTLVGPASYIRTRPLIATINLCGGFAVAALAWRLWLDAAGNARHAVAASTRRATRLALLLLGIQLLLGAWTSANYAGLACPDFPACGADAALRAHGDAGTGLLPWRRLPLDPLGRVIGGADSMLVHALHRAGALAATLAIGSAILLALRERLPRHLPLPVAALLALQIALGIAVVRFTLPPALVLAHNACAVLLLLAMLRLDQALQPMREAPQ